MMRLRGWLGPTKIAWSSTEVFQQWLVYNPHGFPLVSKSGGWLADRISFVL
jgi:hypothetical protein